MAHIEPMDIDIIDSDYEDKENSILHSNVLSRTPCTEKGYEELDVSELNMKLRYSITPASSPMSRSFTANSKDNKYTEEKSNTVIVGNASLTGSFNSTLTNNESYKSSKGGPLQLLSAEQSKDTNKNVLVQRSLDTDVDNNVTITVSDNIDENFSIPSTSSSIPHTPEATTPTKELPKDGGSPIMRGLRSVLSIFRPSQSPIPTQEQSPQQNTSLAEPHTDYTDNLKIRPVQVSTPLAVRKTNRSSPKRNSPLKDSLIFNDDLEKELQWKEESTILFKEEKIPKHKLLLQQTVASNLESKILNNNTSVVNNKTMTDVEMNTILNIETSALESDGEFLDCETTQSKIEIEFHNKTEEKDFKQNQILETNTTSAVMQDTIYTGNNYSLNATVPIGILNESCCISKDINRTVSKEETIIINNDLNDKNLCKINDNAFSTFNDRSLCEIILPVSSDVACDINIQEQQAERAATEEEQAPDVTFHASDTLSTDKYIVNDITNTISPVKDLENNTSSINNFVSSIQNIVKDQDDLSVPDLHHDVNKDISDTAVESLIITNNMVRDNNILHESKIDEKVEHILQRPNIDIFKVTENNTVMKDDNFVTIDQEITNSNTCTEAFNLPNPLNSNNTKNKELLEQSFSEAIHLEENITQSLKNENNLTQIMEIDQTMNLINNNSNKYSVSSKHNEETRDSMLHKDIPIVIRMSCDTEIPLLETNKELHHINEPYQAFQNNINNELSYQGSEDFDKFCPIDKLDCSVTKQNRDILDNTFCVAEEKSNDLSEKFNESKIKYNDEKSADIVSTESKRDLELPTDIPLPSHNEIEHDVLERENQCNITFSSNSESQLKVELESYMNNQNTSPKTCAEMLDILKTSQIENISSLTDEIGEVNNQDSKSKSTDIADETIKFANLDIFEKDDTCQITNKCVLQSENNTNAPSEKKTKCLIESHKEDLETLSLNKADDVHRLVKNDTICNKNNTINLRPDIKENSEILSTNLALEEEFNPFETKSDLQITPPLSPILNKKAYNINFDDVDDPFATKTKIRLSPTPETPPKILFSPLQDMDTERKVTAHKKNLPKNRRKSQPMRKPVNAKKNTLNATFDCNMKKDSIEINVENFETITGTSAEKQETPKPITKPIIGFSETLQSDTLNISDILEEYDPEFNSPIKNIGDVKQGCEVANLTSNLSEPISLRDMAKNVFNCPEINDIKFRSFSDRQNVELPNIPHLPTESNQGNFKSQMSMEEVVSIQVEIKDKKESTLNINDVKSSPTSEQSDTREINTEDEDTEEGPFIDTKEFIEHDNVEQLSLDKDMMHFDASHSAIDSENADNGELFIDAEAFEFLLNQNKSNIIADSGKESLFLKFDPLFAKRVSSDGIIAALKKVQNKQSTPKKLTKLQLKQEPNIPEPGPSKLEIFDDGTEDANVQAISKPMMVVNPAVNSIVSPKKVVTPKINRQSLTFTSPAMAVIDRLLSLSGNNSMVDQNTPVSSPGRQHNETGVAITQLREMLAEKDIHVHNLRTESKELKDRLCNLEAQVQALEAESAERLRKVNYLSDRLIEKTKMNKSMAIVVEEYERTIASLISEMEQEKKNNAEERMMLIKERDEQTAHLASMEVSFSDLHSKYEKSKQIIYSMKANEDTYRKSIKEFEESLEKMQNNYELLKQHATSKLNHANQELEKFNRAHEAEILKLSALIKRKELHITSLEETLTQKTKANQELTAICDELINKASVRGMYDETVEVNGREIDSPGSDVEAVKAAMAKFNPPARHTARHDFDSDSDSDLSPGKFKTNISEDDQSPERKLDRETESKPKGKRISDVSRQSSKQMDSSSSDTDSGDVGVDRADPLLAHLGSGRKKGGVVIPAEGAYDPKLYQDLKVPPELENLFQYIMKYTPQKIDIDFRLQPFVPEYVPAVGDADALIKVTTPASGLGGRPLADHTLEYIDNLGLTVLDEPSAEQSDSALLHLQLRAISKTSSAKSTVLTRKIEQAEKNPKAIERWVRDVSELHMSKPPPSVTYTNKMPDIDSLMEEWPETVEDTLNEVGFLSAHVDCTLAQYVDLVCGVFDIPVHGDTLNDRIQALHLLFSLYSAVKNSQLYSEREKEKGG